MGITKEVITPGDGEHYPKAGDELHMHYVGTLTATGEKFDSSIVRPPRSCVQLVPCTSRAPCTLQLEFISTRDQIFCRDAHATLTRRAARQDKGKPFSFKIGLGQVIRGWDEGVLQMSLGEKSVLSITSDFGYGQRGAGGVIPPDADLCFEVELLAIGNRPSKAFAQSMEPGCALL